MRKHLFRLTFIAILAGSLASCATYKRDCQGGRHTRLANGVVI